MLRAVALAILISLLPLVAYAWGDCGRCAPACDPCEVRCQPKCEPCCVQNTCTKPVRDPCPTACAMPCACTAWETYCGCEMLTSLCISMTADWCDGTAGPLKLLLRDGNYDEIVTIELAGPIEGYYTMEYTFEEPIPADSLIEAVLINETEDPVTLTWLQVYGSFGYCGGWTYIDHSCPGVVVGPGGCPRMVLF